MSQRSRNRQVVRNLADDLAARRAFNEIDPVKSAVGVDAERCAASVRAAQDVVAGFRNEVMTNASLRNELNKMVLACVAFKDQADWERERWQFALMDLREELIRGLRRMEKLIKIEPGEPPAPGSTHGRHLV